MADAHANFAVSAVATAPSPASSGTSLVVTAGHGTRFPAVPFNATVWPAAVQPDPSNAEIVRVTAISTDTLTITRAQESSSARSIVVGDQIAATITAKTLTDVEDHGGLTGLADDDHPQYHNDTRGDLRYRLLSDLSLDGIIDIVGGGTTKVDTLSITGSPTGGTFTLTYLSLVTSALNFNATAAQVQTALQALYTIGPGGVLCTGGPLPDTPITITWAGPWSKMALSSSITAQNSLTGGSSPTISIVNTIPPVPLAPLADAVQIGGPGLYLPNGGFLKFGNAAGTSWQPILGRDSSNNVVLRAGSGSPVMTFDTSSRIGIGLGHITPSAVDTTPGAVSIYNATPTTGVTKLILVAGAGQAATPVLHLLTNLGAAILTIGPTGELKWGAAADVAAAYLDLPEISAPASPAADRGRVYFKDVGGVTKLTAKDSGGTESVLASQAELDAHITDATDAHDASAISFSPTGTIASTDVQAAIAEVASEAGGGGLFNAYAYVRDEKADGTQGGGFTSGAWQTRTLNTEVFDPDGIVSLAANQFTLQAGTYFINARAPAGRAISVNKLRLQNITDATTVVVGRNDYRTTGDTGEGLATVCGRVTIAAAKAFELQHRCSATKATDGFGTACTFGVVEVYAEVEIWREA